MQWGQLALTQILALHALDFKRKSPRHCASGCICMNECISVDLLWEAVGYNTVGSVEIYNDGIGGRGFL